MEMQIGKWKQWIDISFVLLSFLTRSNVTINSGWKHGQVDKKSCHKTLQVDTKDFLCIESRSGCKWDNTSQTCLLFNCFCDYFLRNIPRILSKYSWKNLRKHLKLKKNCLHIILLRFKFKNLTKNVIFKKIQIHLQVFYYLKTNVIVHEFFLNFYSLD
jgi:hypothetical protein